MSLISVVPALAQVKRELKIAFLVPLTGDMAFVGKDIERGARLALAETLESDLSPTLLFEDTVFDLAKTATATRKVIERDGADVIVSLWDEADVVAPITEKAKKLHIAIRWDPAVTENRPLTFTLESTFASYVEAMTTLLLSNGTKTVSVVGQEIKSTLLVFNEMERQFQKKGITVLGQELFSPGSSDFRSLLIRVSAKKPDAVVLFAYPPSIEPLIRQMRQVNPGQRYTGIFELVEDTSLIEGIPSVTPIGSSKEFDEKFRGSYQESYRIRAPHGYEVVRLIKDLYSQLWEETKPDASAVAIELSQVKDRASSLGPLSVTGTRNIEHPIQFIVVENGMRKTISEAELKDIRW